MAKYKKKRARQLQHDKFRDTTMSYVDRAADKLEGKGRQVLYGLGAAIVIGLIIWAVTGWRSSRNDKASEALGHAIKIADTPIVATPVPGSNEPSFRTEKERAQKAVEEFQKVANNYGGSIGEYARYFAANNQLILDRTKGLADLNSLTTSSVPEVATLSKFALAQAKEADGKYDEAATLYTDLVKLNSPIITPDTANLRLAIVDEKLDKKQEAADILFKMVEASRQAKDKNGKPVPQSAAAREATTELEKLDPARYAQLTPPPLPENFTM
ncbi:MAG: hypothetical protein QOC96_987 [Acidobacteriota bacterium]|nr:hypothetical protein [Acidobacteriota bacterium]